MKKAPEPACLLGFRDFPRRGDSRNRTGDQGVADPRLTATSPAKMRLPVFISSCSVRCSVIFSSNFSFLPPPELPLKGTLTPFERSPWRYSQNHSSNNFKIERKIKKRTRRRKMGICSGIFGSPGCLLTDHTKGASIRRSFCDPIKNKYLIRKVGPFCILSHVLSRFGLGWSSLPI